MDGIFNFLRDQLTNHLQLQFGSGSGNVGFLTTGNWDPIVFQENQLTLLMVRLEEEKMMRPPDRFHKMNHNGSLTKVQPLLRLNLYLLIIAQFSSYIEALRQLTSIVRFFQGKSFFQKQSVPALPDDLEQLSMELMTLTFSEQNELWGSLKTTYRPSVLYKVKMLLIDQEEPSLAGDIQETTISLLGK